MSGRSFFGTDGVRGVAGEFPITAQFALQLGSAVGEMLRLGAEERPLVLLGMDTRASSPMLAHALSAGLTSRGVDVGWLGVVPTPAVSYLTREHNAHAGIVVSASHNPYMDNGIKIFNAVGGKLSDEVERDLEALLEQIIEGQTLPFLGGEDIGEVLDAADEIHYYEDHLIKHLPNLDGLKIAIDCANGAASAIAPGVFAKLGADLTVLNADPDGVNINHNCGSTHPETLGEFVRNGEFDLGITFDGDADRVLFIDSKGRLVSGDYMMVINSIVRKEKHVVGTVMTNLGIEHYLKSQGIELLRSQVGDRYMYELLNEHSLHFGAEQSGHLLFLDKAPSGDGMLSALLTLGALQATGRTFCEWIDEVPEYPQVLINVRVTPETKHEIGSHATVLEAVTQGELSLNGTGRVLLRPSGTEPLIRVMVEGSEANLVDKVADQIVNAVERVVATS